MSYSPTTWTTGDTITATAMNKIEQGIANAGGGALIVKATGFGSGSHYYGELMYARWDGTKWLAEYNSMAGGWQISWIGDYAAFSTPIYPLNIDTSAKLFWVVYEPLLNGLYVEMTGDISQNAVTVWTDGGTYGQAGYEITGIGKVVLDNS